MIVFVDEGGAQVIIVGGAAYTWGPTHPHSDAGYWYSNAGVGVMEAEGIRGRDLADTTTRGAPSRTRPPSPRATNCTPHAPLKIG